MLDSNTSLTLLSLEDNALGARPISPVVCYSSCATLRVLLFVFYSVCVTPRLSVLSDADLCVLAGIDRRQSGVSALTDSLRSRVRRPADHRHWPVAHEGDRPANLPRRKPGERHSLRN